VLCFVVSVVEALNNRVYYENYEVSCRQFNSINYKQGI